MNDILEEARNYRRKCMINARAHFLLWEYNSKWNKRLGIPVVVLTTIVGSTLFASKALEKYYWLELLLGILSLIAAILSALSITLRFSDEAEKYKSAGLRYRSMVRQFDFFILKYNNGQHQSYKLNEVHQDFEDLITKLDDLAAESPSIKDRMYFRAVQEVESE